jgi:PAS domain-containing protein
MHERAVGSRWQERRPNLVEVLDDEHSLRMLVDQFPAVFWTTDHELTFTSSLGAGLKSLGLGPNQLVGMSLGDFFEHDAPRPLDAHRRALEGAVGDVPYALGRPGLSRSRGAASRLRRPGHRSDLRGHGLPGVEPRRNGASPRRG